MRFHQSSDHCFCEPSIAHHRATGVAPLITKTCSADWLSRAATNHLECQTWFIRVDEFTFELGHANLFTAQPINLNNGSKMLQFVETKGDRPWTGGASCKIVPCRWSVTHSPARCHLDTDFTHKKAIKKSLIESRRRIQCCWLTKPDALMPSVASGKKLTKKNIEKTGSEPFGNWFGTICTFTWNSVEFNVSKWNSRVSSPPPPGPFTLPSLPDVEGLLPSVGAQIMPEPVTSCLFDTWASSFFIA